MESKLTAYAVCDSPKYFYDFVDEIIKGMYVDDKCFKSEASALVTVIDAKGKGAWHFRYLSKEDLAKCDSIFHF